LAERWAEIDTLGMIQQLGVVPGSSPNVPSGRSTVAVDPSPGGDVAASKGVVRQFVDAVINQGDLAAIDGLVADSYVYHGPGMEVCGPHGLRELLAMLCGAFADWHETLEDLVAEGSRVVFRVTGHGTHEGTFFGIPRPTDASGWEGSTWSASKTGGWPSTGPHATARRSPLAGAARCLRLSAAGRHASSERTPG
jgi:predicted ester cyclase